MQRPGTNKKQSYEAWSILYLAAAVLVLLFPLLGDRTLFFRDIQLLFMPMKHFLAEFWRQGELPLWNPMLFCGAPFLADIQTGVFYPLSIVFYLVPMPYALNMFIITHYIIAACLVYALTRHWNCSIPAACLAAMCFSLGGYLVSTANVLNNLQSAIWLPAVFLCLEKARGRHTLFYGLLGAIFLAIQFLGGEPQLLLFTLLLVFTYNLLVNRQTGWIQHLSKTSVVLAFIGIVGIALVMVQLLPTWEMFRHSIRATGFNFQEATKFSLNPLALFQLLSPPSFDIYGKGQFAWLLSNYFGLMPLVFATSAILFVKDARIKFWAVCLFVSLALALGKHTPLFFLLYKAIPFLNSFRFPEKFMFIFAYAIAFLSAFGFDCILERGMGAGKRVISIFVFLVVLFLVGSIIRTSCSQPALDCVSPTVRFFLFVCVSLSCIFLFFKKVLNKSTFSMLVVVVSTVDLISAHMPFNPVVPEEFYADEPELVHTVGKNKDSERIFVQASTYKDFHGRSLPPVALQHIWRHYLWPNTGTLYDISYVNGIGGTEARYQWLVTELLEKLNLKKRIRLLELTNTRYLVAIRPEAIESEVRSDRLIKVQKNLYQLPCALPRAYMAPEVKIVPNQAKAIEEILEDDFDPRQCVVLEKGAQVSLMDGEGGEVLYMSYAGPNKVNATARSLGGYLVLLDSFYPGWRVIVDGQERELLRANGLFKSVFLEPGLHRIVFTYQPRSFAWGSRISFISVCLVMVGLWIWRPKRRIYSEGYGVNTGSGEA